MGHGEPRIVTVEHDTRAGGGLTRWSIEHPWTIVAFYLGVAVLGVLVIFFQMPRRMMPYVESPIVGVVSMMPGLSAEDMETYFSKPIEAAQLTSLLERFVPRVSPVTEVPQIETSPQAASA